LVNKESVSKENIIKDKLTGMVFAFGTNMLVFNLALVSVIVSFMTFLDKGINLPMAYIAFVNVSMINVLFRLEDSNAELTDLLHDFSDEDSVRVITNSLALVNLLMLFAVCVMFCFSMSANMRLLGVKLL